MHRLKVLGGTEAGKEIRWGNVMKKAEGTKIKDDPELLKRAIRREHTKKKKSAMEWAKRDEEVKTSKEQRQKKREENIHDRRQTIINKKLGIKTKKPKK